jgi:hypothetical protein
MLYSSTPAVLLAVMLAKTTWSASVTQSSSGNGPPQTAVNRSDFSKNMTQQLIISTSPLQVHHSGKHQQLIFKFWGQFKITILEKVNGLPISRVCTFIYSCYVYYDIGFQNKHILLLAFLFRRLAL